MTSLRSAETSSTAIPGAREFDDLFADEFRRTDVNAARRLVGKNQHRVVRELARNDDLLDVTAGKHADLLLSRFAKDGVLLDEPVGFFVDGLHVEQRALIEALVRAAVGEDVFLDAGRARNAKEHPVLRNEGHARGREFCSA